MGYNFTIKNYYQVKKDGHYPAPCAADKNRKYELFTDDVLTKSEDGTYTVHTGLCICGIKLKWYQVKKVKDEVVLHLL